MLAAEWLGQQSAVCERTTVRIPIGVHFFSHRLTTTNKKVVWLWEKRPKLCLFYFAVDCNPVFENYHSLTFISRCTFSVKLLVSLKTVVQRNEFMCLHHNRQRNKYEYTKLNLIKEMNCDRQSITSNITLAQLLCPEIMS